MTRPRQHGSRNPFDDYLEIPPPTPEQKHAAARLVTRMAAPDDLEPILEALGLSGEK